MCMCVCMCVCVCVMCMRVCVCVSVRERERKEEERESLSWIRMTRTARQDARRSGKEDAGHSLFLEEDETLLKMHVNKKRVF